MRRLAMVVLAAGMVVLGILAQRPPAVAEPVASPQVLPDRRVTFRLLAPKASEVAVSGEFMSGSKPLQKDEKGLWSVTAGPLPPDIYAYQYMVDGLKIIDPNNPVVKTGSRPSTTASLLEVPGDGAAFYDTRPVAHGTVQVRWYASKALDSQRRVHIYTPPNYDKETSRYPVLYLFHGANADDTAWTSLGRANRIVDNLLADGKLRPLVVVMPFGYAYAPNDSGGVGLPNSDRQASGFSRDLIEDLIPFVQASYRVYTDRDHRAIVGLSMGGGQALRIGLGHLDLFSRVAGFSAAVPRSNVAEAFKEVAENPKKVNDQLKLLWVGCGTADSLFAADQAFSEFLKTSGVKHTFRATEGAHTWQVWRRYLYEVAPQLFSQS
jgi:enterochelin esterase-like enzyme